MSKRLPYFQFEPAEWLAGDIMFCSMESQGLYVNLMALYWQKDCDLSLEQAMKRLNSEKSFEELISEKIIKVESGKIQINFLNDQWGKLSEKSNTNSDNGRKGAMKRWQKNSESIVPPKVENGESNSHAIATPLKSDSEPYSETIALRREEKRREEKIKEESKVKKSNEFDFSFVNSQFKEIFELWLQYKKERKETYKSQMSLEQSYKLLLKHSNNDSKLAAEVVNQTIGNNWAGLQPLKQQFLNQKSVNAQQYKDSEIWPQQ